MSGILPQEIIHPKAEHFEGPDDLIQIKLKKAAYARDQKMKVLVQYYQRIRDIEAGGKWDPEASRMSQSSQPFRPQNTMILMEKQAIAKIAIK